MLHLHSFFYISVTFLWCHWTWFSCIFQYVIMSFMHLGDITFVFWLLWLDWLNQRAVYSINMVVILFVEWPRKVEKGGWWSSRMYEFFSCYIFLLLSSVWPLHYCLDLSIIYHMVHGRTIVSWDELSNLSILWGPIFYIDSTIGCSSSISLSHAFLFLLFPTTLEKDVLC